jgi:hypothetical protein
MSNLGIGISQSKRVSVPGLSYLDQPLLPTQGVCQLDVSVELGLLNRPVFTIDNKTKPSLCLNPGLIYRFNQNTLENQKNPLAFSGQPDNPNAPLPQEIELLYFVSGNRVTKDFYETSINNYLQQNTYYIEFRVPKFAESQVFYYWSTNNRRMGSTIRIGGFQNPCKKGEADIIPCNNFYNRVITPPIMSRQNPRTTPSINTAYGGSNWALPPRPSYSNNR